MSTETTYTPTTVVGAQLCERVAAMQGQNFTLELAWLLDLAIGTMFQQVAEIVSDVGVDGEPDYVPGYGVLLDPVTCPDLFLPYLANFAGVAVTPGRDPGTVRAMIQGEPGQKRGRPSAIIAAAQRNLSGTQSVSLVPRTRADGSRSRWAFQLVVRPEEIVSQASLVAAVNAVKPAGVKWTLIQSDAPLLTQYTLTFAEITAPIGAATLAQVT